MFKQGPRNIVTACSRQAVADVQPRQLKYGACCHEGWLETMDTCEACRGVGHLEQLPVPAICAMCRESDGKAESWDDVTGAEFKCERAVKARKEEIEHFKEHGVYEKVKEEIALCDQL